MRQLADVLADVAERAKVYDVTDRAVRGARRRRWTRLAGRTGAAVTAVVLAVTCGSLALVRIDERFGGPGRPEPGPGRLAGDPPALVRPLLDSPTRGSLAGDTGYVQALLDRVAGDADRYGLPADPSKLRVLFAGDLPGNQRLALVAGATANPRLIHLTGGRGTGASRLKLTGWDDVDTPIVRSEWRDGPRGNGYALIFGPTGYDAFTSDAPRYLVDGTVKRDWKPEPAGFILVDLKTIPRGLRVRFSRGDTVLYEAGVASPGAKRDVDVDPNPLFGRGRPEPRAANEAADALAYSSGLTGPDVHFVVLWSDDYDVDPSGGANPGQIATVMAVTRDGGGPYLTLAVDASKEPLARDHPTGAGVFGDPQHALIVMRLPYFGGPEPQDLKIVAPSGAVRAEVIRDGAVAAATPLANGVGSLHLPGPVEVTVRVLDAAGAVVAERPFKDVTGNAPPGLYEPEIKGW
jgi:hypothetical protein